MLEKTIRILLPVTFGFFIIVIVTIAMMFVAGSQLFIPVKYNDFFNYLVPGLIVFAFLIQIFLVPYFVRKFKKKLSKSGFILSLITYVLVVSVFFAILIPQKDIYTVGFLYIYKLVLLFHSVYWVANLFIMHHLAGYNSDDV